MKSGSYIAATVLLAYVGFEAYAIKKVSHKIEPDYIHALLVNAKFATEQCNSDALELSERFDRTLERVSAAYKAKLLDTQPGQNSETINSLLDEKKVKARELISDEIELLGCDTTEMKAHFQRYRIYANKTR